MKKNTLVKKLLGCGLAFTFAFGLAGCGAKDESEMTQLEKIKDKGVMTVGTSPDYAPYEFIIMENGQKKVVGFDIAMAEEIAKDLDVKLELKEMDFKMIVESVKNGRIDLGISGLTPDDERKKLVDFSMNYYEVEQGMLVKKDSTINTKDDLKGKKIGAQTGSVQAEMADTIEGAEVKKLDDVNTLILDLKNGKLDVILLEIPVANTAAAANEDLRVGDEKIIYEKGGNAVAIKKGESDLVEAVNKTLERLIKEGKMEQFIKDAEALVSKEVPAE
ncbi:MAG: transporter substrate-binding domain-containing protein [Clostridium sp.]